MAIDEQRSRVLEWEGCYNARDLGGYPTDDGRQTQWERIVRSDNLARLSPLGRDALQEYGVSTIIDLRLPAELKINPPPFREHLSINYQNISFVDPAVAELSPEFRSLAKDYLGMLERFKASVANVMAVIAEAPSGAVLIHCHAGKDRTGLISALLLRVAGVPIHIAAEDYGLTTELLRPLDEEWLENGPNDLEWRRSEFDRFMARAEVMQEVLQGLETEYGTVEAYLLDAGVTQDDIGRLRARLLD